MSSSTWTPAALSSEATPLAGTAWRLVEAQHHVSTLKLVDSVAEQELLERLVEETKPAIPPECRGLHHLLYTPFRYGPYPKGSRFRRAGATPGVFYAAEAPATAVAETSFHRLLFFAESPATPWPSNPAEFTAFAVDHATGRALDLDAGALASIRAAVTHPTDYTIGQSIADAAREAGIDVIRYPSVRDPGGGANLALLSCRAFASPAPTGQQTWRLRISDTGVHAICAAPAARITFDRACFAADPRIAAMIWDRS
ncbi:RES family NAD+ phosphorylase [Rhodoplanes sp. TEM]|uniref:RES family NAD+ phosphorylase n=1 Tax=Rhodoplanes tepidamans TaxID=200616 RepID=A0ABT5J991_RHOTP|nr:MULTISPECIES: RES family NAD+ phosphorylase [Rhodoplanes]MDC7786177.1 RES family NAD+ phosphorylase [Rhodoplanes tepidamans]MDC7982844.1 RES family NAD+ phosphorylase [Rhodoplanes sp. TEM]MDQ0357158.1 hypothetical protein [Rhodoplanes tepidamans]